MCTTGEWKAQMNEKKMFQYRKRYDHVHNRVAENNDANPYDVSIPQAV